MDILVTGGGGFLGSAVCRQLAALGHRVTAFQRKPALHLADFGVESVTGDVCDRERLIAAARGCDAIVHTAAKAGIWGDPAEYRRINVDGTRNVVAACRAAGVGLLVHTSSPSVVHTGEDIVGGDESLPLAQRFSAPYPETKAAAERRVLAANGPELKTCALRPHLIWGPGDPHILPRLVAKARGGRLALPAPHKLIDTVFVENAALAHVKALQELAGRARCAGKAYFVTNNEPLAQGEIIRSLLAAHSRRSRRRGAGGRRHRRVGLALLPPARRAAGNPLFRRATGHRALVRHQRGGAGLRLSADGFDRGRAGDSRSEGVVAKSSHGGGARAAAARGRTRVVDDQHIRFPWCRGFIWSQQREIPPPPGFHVP